MMVTVEKLVEWKLAGKTEVLGENLPQRHFVHHKSHMTRLVLSMQFRTIRYHLIHWRCIVCTKYNVKINSFLKSESWSGSMRHYLAQLIGTRVLLLRSNPQNPLYNLRERERAWVFAYIALSVRVATLTHSTAPTIQSLWCLLRLHSTDRGCINPTTNWTYSRGTAFHSCIRMEF
jgi:hypothetical protein